MPPGRPDRNVPGSGWTPWAPRSASGPPRAHGAPPAPPPPRPGRSARHGATPGSPSGAPTPRVPDAVDGPHPGRGGDGGRAPVADDRRPPGAGAAPPTSWPAPRVAPAALPAPPEPSRRSPALVGFVSFLVGALLVGAAFGAYALGDRKGRSGTTAVRSTTTAPPARSTTALDIHKILDLAQPSVVTIQAGSANSIFGSAGSGVVLEADGLIVTNAHVIADAPVIQVRFSDGTQAQAELVGASTAQDIALIKVPRTDLTPAKLGSSANLRVGDDVVAIGNALNLGGDPSVTRGIVSAKDRSISSGKVSLQHLIQTDAAINPGNSGGALVNADGEVVGINTAIIDGAQNVGFALSIDAVKDLVPKLKAGGGDVAPVQADLGIDTLTVDAKLDDGTRRQYGITASSGALVTAIHQESAAADAGIEEGDVITDVDGTPVVSASTLEDVVHSFAPGDEVTVTVERQGRRRSFVVTLGG